MNERFRACERLRRKKDILTVVRQRGIAGVYCILHFRRHNGPRSRLVVVARRTVGNAVVRNRAKRRIREIFRQTKGHLKQTVDIAVRIKPAMRGAAYSDIYSDLLSLLRRGKLLDIADPKR